MDRSPFLPIIYNYLELKCYLRTQAAKTNKQTKKKPITGGTKTMAFSIRKWLQGRGIEYSVRSLIGRQILFVINGMRVWLINAEKKLYMKAKILLSEELTRLNVKALIVRTGCNYLPWSILTFLTDTIVVLQ